MIISGGDPTNRAIHAALHGLDARRAAHENNIANVETPGYIAQRVDFESALKRAMEAGNPELTPTVSTTNDVPRANGNNVNLGQEMVSLTETALTQELLVRALNDKYGLIRGALGQ
ncbi:MAG: flagellar biosynthesis protein FlgB [Actinomycetota bacterium]